MAKIYCFLFLLFSFTHCFAQKEASFWFNQFYGLNFGQFPPTTVPPAPGSSYHVNRASVADASGNLLFSTDGMSYFDKTGQVMPNGQGISVTWGTTYLPVIIAPVPGSTTQYYSFMVRQPLSTTQADFDTKLRYSLIDMSLNNGKGDVVQKDIVIADKQHDGFTLIKTPDDPNYWLISQSMFGDTLNAYRITQQGIAQKPVITSGLRGLGNINSGGVLLKSSPDGRFLTLSVAALQTGTENQNMLKIVRFDNKTGLFMPFRQITRSGVSNPNANPSIQTYLQSTTEFSADSRFLYVVEDSIYQYITTQNLFQVTSNKTLVCYDLTASNTAFFDQSRQVLFKFPETPYDFTAFMQLTPQKKIVISDVTNIDYGIVKALSVIQNPSACTIVQKGFSYQSIPVGDRFATSLPVFPSWYFYEPPAKNDFAGPNASVCNHQSVKLGTTPRPNYTYNWQPAGLISNANTANPTYQPSIPTTSANDTVQFYAKMTDPTGCVYYDSVQVIVKGVNTWKIQGSRSVCPGVKGVSYWIEDKWKGKQITWQVQGGTIVSGQNTDTIRIDWNTSNLQASVSAISINTNGCQDNINPFPVKVFKYLETEQPKGRDTLLCSQWIEMYHILPTNGSVYDWQVINGQVIAGQGSAQVTIRWEPTMQAGKVWINESVNTQLEICFGRSDTLTVINPKTVGNENVHLYNVSGVLNQPDQLKLQYVIQKTPFYLPEVLIQTRILGQLNWQNAGTTTANSQTTFITNQPLDSLVSEYRLVAFTICGDSAISEIHRNILLQGTGMETDKKIVLTWNPYTTWSGGAASYELFRKLDEDSDFLSFKTSTLPQAILPGTTEGFQYCFYVTGQSTNGIYQSLSNQLCLTFENPLFIPNVITPDGDGKNDTWYPEPLNLYSANQVRIVNQWGIKVFEARDYQGDWGAANLPSGVYYYEFIATERKQAFKGFLQVFK
ncbi:gliding motility-associated C-terminal domain-containing protein [Cytophagaceae bacterium YF14B1]|uniref:Gliding motility-associated C-terminal domain-containing protein n=1 Tax=Xanthocytophaga flava TaxID=3048013 RepID=A0AAE3QTI1_9BACT|nr:gliding motility-associated C-terminal domain-containing protein [Xanthocytophaga flavus]MDJ1482950.1 gliding motility-associated C-terminal domain-containing protein [Xanthocytophaga flavus]